MRSYKLQSNPYLLLLPCLTFSAVLVVYGAFLALEGSLQGTAGQLSLNFYQRLWSMPEFWDSLWWSLKIAVASTITSLVLGTVLTKLIYESFRGSWQRFWVFIPMLIPHFVAAYMVYALLAPSGWISGVLHHLHLVRSFGEFPLLVNDPNGLGIILTYIWKEVPFVTLMLLPVYHQLNPQYAQVVRTLGGSGWDVFRTAEWPWIAPVLLEAGVILVAFILSAYEVPYLLGVTYPKMTPILAYQWFYAGNWGDRPLAMAAMVTVSIIVVTLAFGVLRLVQTQRYRGMRGR